jgi:hypothetical protein
MATGYTRNDTTNNIANGNIINANDLDGEFDAIQAAYDATTGHAHDGTVGGGAPIGVLGPTQDIVVTNTVLRPKTDNTVDLGSNTLEFKDLWIDGTANIDSLVADTADINGGTIDGATIATSDITVGAGKTLNVSAGTLTLANDQISGDKVEGGTINAITINTLGSTTGNITNVNATTIDTTNLEVTAIKAKDGTAAATIADSTGVVTVASSVLTTTDINGGTIDGVTIGGASAGAITGTTITATGDVTIPDKIVHAGDTNTSIRFPADDTVTVETNGAERLRVTSTGNVGIGTTSPSVAAGLGFVLNGGSGQSRIALKNNATTDDNARGLQFAMLSTGEAIIDQRENQALRFTTNTEERMRITAAGNVGIGTTNLLAKLHVSQASADVYSGTTLSPFSVGNTIFVDNTDSTVGSFGQILFRNGSSGIIYNRIVSVRDASSQGSLAFVTGSSSSAAERMRIDSAGNVGIGTSVPSDYNASADNLVVGTTSGNNGITIASGSAGQGSLFFADGTASGAEEAAGFLAYVHSSNVMIFGTQNAERMRIDSTGNVGIGTTTPATPLHVNGTIRYTNRPAAGTITAIGFDANGDLRASSSSLRYKYDIEDYEKGLAEVMQLRPVSFKFNGEQTTNIGFIAEEVDALGLTEVMLYNEGSQPEGVVYSNMVSLLTKAIQEQQATITALEARITALEAK